MEQASGLGHGTLTSSHCRCAGGAEESDGGGRQEDDDDITIAVEQIAEMALLGAGCADVLYPTSLDELYAQTADELVFRVAL